MKLNFKAVSFDCFIETNVTYSAGDFNYVKDIQLLWSLQGRILTEYLLGFVSV